MTRWCVAITGVFFIAMYSGLVFSDNVDQSQMIVNRNDVLRIDSSVLFEKNERPAVLFFHDLHTDALSGNKSGCKTCHVQKGPAVSFDFIPADKKSREERMNAYHDRCIGCHTSSLSAGEDGGPVICSGCHREKNTVERFAVSGRFDKSLHQRHTDALEKSCTSCHHVYDTVTKKTVYEKGKEGSCAYCHPEKDNGKDMSLSRASHLQCITCHVTRKDASKIAGPVRCEGCHDSGVRASVKKAEIIARMDMGQKDYLMLRNPDVVTADTPPNRMNLVPFDHRSHEEKNDSCHTCHHKELIACTQCHTLKGTEKGGYVSLEKIMHDPRSQRSCEGCHTQARQDAVCSGCHGFDQNRTPADDTSCVSCHVARVLETDQQKQAEDIIRLKTREKISPDVSTIPETLTLKTLEKKYLPVVFPHRKIVKTLTDKISGSRMAQFFHTDKNTVCLGCHHNAPATNTPTACGSCHSGGDMESESYKPGLVGAYHIQCMECHARMEIRQPESCTQCHKEKG